MRLGSQQEEGMVLIHDMNQSSNRNSGNSTEIKGRQITYSALGSDTADRVDPDVLRHGGAFLVELHVLHELYRETC